MDHIGVCLSLFGLSVAIITIQNNFKKSREDQNIVELRHYERAILAVIANEGDIADVPTPTNPQITKGLDKITKEKNVMQKDRISLRNQNIHRDDTTTENKTFISS